MPDLVWPMPHPRWSCHMPMRLLAQTPNRTNRPRLALAASTLVLVLSACGSGREAVPADATEPSGPTASASALVTEPTPTRTPEPTPEPTPVPTAATTTFAVDDVITITQNGDPWADFTVLEVQEAAEFVDPDGFFNDTPQTSGYVYLAAKVRYVAVTDGVDYNPFDFQIFVGGQAVDSFAFALNGPEPELSSGTLPQGRSAEGWILYEVPPTGEVLLSYGNMFLDEAPVFEVVLRGG